MQNSQKKKKKDGYQSQKQWSSLLVENNVLDHFNMVEKEDYDRQQKDDT